MYLDGLVAEGSNDLQEASELSECRTRVMCWSRALIRLCVVCGEEWHTYRAVLVELYE
jgi:hypothetical protein